MPKVSVIVPVYNVEKYLIKSLDSLVNQTLEDIEIIVVNDGSTDNSKKIIEVYKEKYQDKIKYLEKPNGGLSDARNFGIPHATGEYIAFLDSDDYVELDTYEKMYNKAKEENADIVCCKYDRIYNAKRVVCDIGKIEDYGKNLHENPELLNCGVPYIWNKIFKKSLIEENKFEFENYKIFEDLLFTYKCFLKANKISMVEEVFYHYIRNRNSSVMSSFSYKLFDIFDVIKELTDYYKANGAYEEFEQYLLAVVLNHIYIRLNTKIKFKEIPVKYKFINQSFKFLNENFNGWKKSEYYFEIKRKSRRKYTSKMYWMSKLYVAKYKKIPKKVKRNAKKVIFSDNKGAKYLKYIKTKPIDPKSILIDSQHGENISGNMFYILKEVYTNEEYEEFKIFVTVTKKNKKKIKEKLDFYGYKNLKLININSGKYLKLLATSKYLFNDTSFMPYFIKREEQVYVNTWHGTPLKTLGRKVKNEYHNFGNLQKNFIVSDYLLYPSEYMMEHMLEDYMIDNISNNKIILSGYPRNTIFFDEESRKNIKIKENLEGKEIIAYMPTWRGILKDVQNPESFIEEVFEEIDKNLKENQLLYVNFHPYLDNRISFEKYNKIRKFPNSYETYEFLNICDKLITDYSSVFFDYAVTRNKIILYAYDEEEYFKERGVYVKLDELPFPKVDNVQDLIKEINSPINYDMDKFIDKFCKYDAKDVTKKICNKVILNKKEDIKIIPIPNNKKKNILIFGGNLYNCDTTDELFKYINSLDFNKANYYLTFVTRKISKNKEILLELPNEAKYIGQLGGKNTTLYEKILLMLLGRTKFAYDLFYKRYKKMFCDEKQRIFGNIKFDTVIVFGSKSGMNLAMFSEFDCKKELYIYSKSNINNKINSKIYNKYDKIFERNKQSNEKSISKNYEKIEAIRNNE